MSNGTVRQSPFQPQANGSGAHRPCSPPACPRRTGPPSPRARTRRACRQPLAAIFCLLTAASAPAAALDLHRLWEERCAGCHGEAGDFARRSLHEVEGRLQGRRPERDLAAFLGGHRGGLPPAEAEAVLAMLQAQAGTPPRFRERCGICHPKAADLVRDHLILRDGVLVGRYGGRRMDDFLRRHGRLDAEGAAFFLDLLTRIEGEVHHPPS